MQDANNSETMQNAGLNSPQGLSEKKQKIQNLIRIVGMLPVLILLCIGFELLTGRFISLQNISIVAQQASINIVLAAGMTFVILTGGIDLSVGSILAASAMVAVIGSKIPSMGMLGIAAGLGMGLALGIFNGALIAGLRLPRLSLHWEGSRPCEGLPDC